MREETRELMQNLVRALRDGWADRAIPARGVELVLLAAATVTDPDAFEGYVPAELAEAMQALYEQLRATDVNQPEGRGPEPLPPLPPHTGRGALRRAPPPAEHWPVPFGKWQA